MATKFIELKYRDHDDNEQVLNVYALEMDPLIVEGEVAPVTTSLLTTAQGFTYGVYCNWYKPSNGNNEYFYAPIPAENLYIDIPTIGNLVSGNPLELLTSAFRTKLYEMAGKLNDPTPRMNVIRLDSASDRSKMFYEDGTFGDNPPRNPYNGQEFTFSDADGNEAKLKFAMYVRDDMEQGSLVPYCYMSGIHTINPPSIISSYGNDYTVRKVAWNSEDPHAMGFWWTTVHCDREGDMPTMSPWRSGGDGDMYGQDIEVLICMIRNGSTIRFSIIPYNVFEDVDASEPTTDTPSETNVTPSGWTGNFDFSSDSDTHVTPTGFGWANQWAHGINIYNLTSAQVGSFLDCMWDFSITKNLGKKLDELFGGANTNWLQGIVSLHILPCTVTHTGTDQLITIFGQMIGTTATGKKMYTGTSQHIVTIESKELPIGNTLPKNVFLDYENCSAYVKLPFVGQVPIDIRKFRDGSLQVTYDIDVLTGNCVAQIYATSKPIPGYADSTGKKILIYQGSGNCAIHIPYCGNTEGGFKQLQAVSGIGMAAIGAATGSGLAVAGGLASTISSPTSNTEQHSYLASEAGPMMHPYVKLVVEGPVPLVPTSQQKDWGFKAFTTAKVNDFAYYPQKPGKEFLQGKIHCTIARATDAEKREIEALFAKGVLV